MWSFEDFFVYFIEVLGFYCYRIIPGNFAGARNSIHFLGFVNSVTMNNKACAVFVVTKGRETMPCIISRSFIQAAGRDGFHSRCYPNVWHVINPRHQCVWVKSADRCYNPLTSCRHASNYKNIIEFEWNSCYLSCKSPLLFLKFRFQIRGPSKRTLKCTQ